ncbi:erg26, C-3 sterol dehydrogenase [Blastocladiella emersonii ATCC 22665]|nr:erg26, C-3 sterol dehydrogenase [Blastocladiella emersonii ATCC 22665]
MVAPPAKAAVRQIRIDDTVLVVGGDGFLGSHIVEYLLEARAALPEDKRAPVHVLDLQQRFPDREGVVYHIGSLLDHEFLVRTLSAHGITCVIHTASPPHGRGRPFYWSVNVDGTKTLIQACLAAGVAKFVYTSSASVVFNGADVSNINEDALYCETPLDAYTETKAAAEDLVLKSNNLPTTNGGSLLTCAVRPSGIFGPRDGQQLPGMMEVVASKSHLVVGDGKNMFDFTYVENVAVAHLLAAAKLAKGSGVDGEAFFVTNDDPIPFWDFPVRLMHKLLPPTDPRIARAGSVHLPRWLMMGLAYVASFFVWLISPVVKIDILFTPFRMRLATAARTFDCSKAKARLGYRPLLTLDQALDESVAWIKSVDKWRPIWNPVEPEKDELVEDLKIKEE